MSWADQTVADFGRSMGMPDLQFNEQGVVSLSFENTGDLFVERLEEDDEVLIYLVREVPVGSRRQSYCSALELSHWNENNPFPISPALLGEDRLVFSTRISAADFTLPTIERVLSMLEKMHNGVAAA